MKPEVPFVGFAKIARMNREIVVTEKIDGTNACIYVDEAGGVFAGSRTRWITRADDNFGFAQWVFDHADELRSGLGLGTHYGEWWGQGIQRKYGLTEKRFSLFNVGRWTDETKPACCHVVPTLYRGRFSQHSIDGCVNSLRANGSLAAQGFMNPEGVVVFHVAANTMFKITLERDDEYKGNRATKGEP